MLIAVTWPEPRVHTNEAWRIMRCLRELPCFKDASGTDIDFILQRGYVEVSDADGMKLASRLETAGIRCDLFAKDDRP